jgi:hypothetical protein
MLYYFVLAFTDLSRQNNFTCSFPCSYWYGAVSQRLTKPANEAVKEGQNSDLGARPQRTSGVVRERRLRSSDGNENNEASVARQWAGPRETALAIDRPSYRPDRARAIQTVSLEDRTI